MKPEKMFLLSDEHKKEEKIDPQSIDKVPEDSGQAQTQMIFHRVQIPGVFVDHPHQDDDTRKDMQQVGRRDHIEKRRSHIALGPCRVQPSLNELVEAIELIKDKGQAQNQGNAEKQIRSRVIPRKQGSFGQHK